MKFRTFCFAMCTSLFLGSTLTVMGQDGDAKKKPAADEFQFTDVVTVKTTSVKDQNRAGTCWSYSGLGFFESELLRMGKGEYDLSEMFIVRNTYYEKAIRYVRFHGKLEFAAGGSFKDVQYVMENFGIVPEEAYRGLNYGEENHVHGELDDVLRGYVNGVLKNSNRHLSTAWRRGFSGILDAYLGEYPESFTYKGATYTPKSFIKMLGLNMEDYVCLTSFTHHPWYKPCVLEIPDNWAHGNDYNVPIDDLMAVIDNALNAGYPVAWGSDISEKGFMYGKGVAVVPIKKIEETDGAEILRWTTLTDEEKAARLMNITGPVPELKIDQEMRQEAFDNWQTTDDHGMLIVGIAKDQYGNKYYKVKNSWAANGKYGGYFYASAAFVAYKTIDIMVNKKSIPSSIRKKLDL